MCVYVNIIVENLIELGISTNIGGKPNEKKQKKHLGSQRYFCPQALENAFWTFQEWGLNILFSWYIFKHNDCMNNKCLNIFVHNKYTIWESCSSNLNINDSQKYSRSICMFWFWHFFNSSSPSPPPSAFADVTA